MRFACKQSWVQTACLHGQVSLTSSNEPLGGAVSAMMAGDGCRMGWAVCLRVGVPKVSCLQPWWELLSLNAA